MQNRNSDCLAVMMWRMTTVCGLFGEDWGKCGRLELRQWLPGWRVDVGWRNSVSMHRGGLVMA